MQIATSNQSPRQTLLNSPANVLARLRLLLPLAAAALAACAAPGAENTQEQLRQRVTQRWQALIAADYARSYTFATPTYRAAVTPEAYRGRKGVAVQRVSAEIFSVNCPEPTKCKVRVEVGAKPPLGSRYGNLIVKAPVDESWLFENGQWWVAERP